MITIDLLKNHSESIPALASIWHEVLGKIWVPDIPVERVITRFQDHLNDQDLPITFVALDGDLPVGMCSLRENDGIRPDLNPWLGSLVVDPNIKNRGSEKCWLMSQSIKQKSLALKSFTCLL
jgi:hypothetical protein